MIVATPIGHMLAGYAAQGIAPGPHLRRAPMLLLAVTMANAPDLDFVPGLVVGAPALYHQGVTHSLALGLTVAFVAAIVLRRLGTPVAVTFLVSALAIAAADRIMAALR